MNAWFIYAIGFAAQLLFSSRLFVQWVLSEKSRKIVNPAAFWKLSLFASFLMFIYGYLRQDLAIMLGQALTYFIYIRNLQLQGQWQKSPRLLRYFLWIFPVAVILYGYNNGKYDMALLLHNADIPSWLMFLGIGSQILFTLRFVYQWIYSEKHRVSELPVGFWRINTLGAFFILIYAIFRHDPVLFIGHIAGLTIYIRNIMIGKKQQYEAI